MGIFDFLKGEQEPQLSKEEVISIFKNCPQGDIKRVLGVEQYEDFIVIFLDKGEPIIGFLINNRPLGMYIWPEEGDELIFIKNGVSVPIIYNKTANSYLYSERADEFITKALSFLEDIDMPGIRQKLAIQYEPNLAKQIVQSIYKNTVSRIMIQLSSPFIITKIFSFVFSSIKDELAQRQFLKKFNFQGKIVSHKIFSYVHKGREGTQTTSYFIPVRIYWDTMNIFISCLYEKSPMLSRKFELPPENADVSLTGKIHIKEKFFKIDTLYFGKHKILY